jgi:hypothetical protein
MTTTLFAAYGPYSLIAESAGWVCDNCGHREDGWPDPDDAQTAADAHVCGVAA